MFSVGQRVKNKNAGIGIVTDIDNSHTKCVRVRFDCGHSFLFHKDGKFLPDAICPSWDIKLCVK